MSGAWDKAVTWATAHVRRTAVYQLERGAVSQEGHWHPRSYVRAFAPLRLGVCMALGRECRLRVSREGW